MEWIFEYQDWNTIKQHYEVRFSNLKEFDRIIIADGIILKLIKK